METPKSRKLNGMSKRFLVDILICSVGWDLSILLLWIIRDDPMKMVVGATMLAMALGVNTYSLFIEHGRTKCVYLMSVTLSIIGLTLGFVFDWICTEYVMQRRLSAVLAIGLVFGAILGCCVSLAYGVARYLVVSR